VLGKKGIMLDDQGAFTPHSRRFTQLQDSRRFSQLQASTT
jgi:hypothetical protein